MKAQAKKENAAAAGANCENAEANTEEVERMCTGKTRTQKPRRLSPWRLQK